ncbi:MAG: molybdopterin-dependent oxidoreductase [Gemmatimonadaceae bacterium]|nr:molybdopterin-dependent oxidoreductase [Gemmatimonadaceae bacterium]
MRSVERREFLKGIAAVSAATAGSALAPGTLLSATTGYSQDAQSAVDWSKAPCRMCGVGCGLLIAIENGRAGAVKGDAASAVGKGLACAKGYYSVQALYGRDRITRAMIRRGRGLSVAPMSEALDLVAQRLRETIQRYGKDSVAIYGSAQWSIPDAYVASKLFKGGIGTNNVESSSRLYAASAMAGLQTSFGLDGAIGCYEDVDQADVFVLWDINLAETDPVLFSRMLDRRRRDRSVRIVDLTTRTTRTSYAADRSLLHRPHSGLALANAIAREIVARKWVDREFVDRHVAFKRGKTGIGHGLTDDALVADEAIAANGGDYESFLAPYTAERAQQISGLSAGDIRWLASLYGDRARKVMTVWGEEANRHSRGTWLNNVLYNIHLLVGKIASPGNAALSLAGQPSGGNAVHDAGSLSHTLPRGLVSNAVDRRRAATIWGVPADTISARPARTALPLFRALDRGDIRFLWIQATNPMVSLPNLSRYRRAAAKDGRFLVVSEAYPTPTSDAADVVLPAAMWLEREGVFANVERRAQHFEQIVAPPGEAMSDAWQMIEVARRMGLTRLFPWERRDHVARIWEEYRRFHTDDRSALPAISELRARPGVIWPFVGGRETKWRYNTAHDPAADRARGGFDFYGHADHRAWIWLRPHEPPAESPDRAYPFWLTVGAVLEHFGGGAMTQRIPTLHRSVPRAYLEMNRDDANRLGIRNRETVRLVSRRGAIEIEARIDYRSRPPRGQLFAPSFDEGVPVRQLMLDAFCPLSGQPDTTICAVRVERLGGRNVP